MKGINPALVIGIGLPFALVAVLFAVIFIPSSLLNPEYDFVYSNENPNGYSRQFKYSYVFKDGAIVAELNSFNEKQIPQDEYPILYRYNIKENTVRQIDFEEAASLTLLPGPSSPDGFTVSYEYSNSGGLFLFGGDSRSGYFIKKGNAGKPLSGMSTYGYYTDFTLLGWVQK